jgi:hypothetical protein
MATGIDETTWCYKAAARRRLRVSPRKLDQLIEAGHLGVVQVPGCFARVCVEDIEALLQRSTRPATVPRDQVPRDDESRTKNGRVALGSGESVQGYGGPPSSGPTTSPIAGPPSPEPRGGPAFDRPGHDEGGGQAS